MPASSLLADQSNKSESYHKPKKEIQELVTLEQRYSFIGSNHTYDKSNIKTIYRAKAPLRLGLAGGGTDISPYSDLYGGAVLNAAINMYAFASIQPRTDGMIEIISTDFSENLLIQSSKSLDINGNLILLKGIYNKIVKDFTKKPLSFTLITDTNVPICSGLGTSSAITVAVIGAFAEWLQLPLGEYEVAHLAFEIERKELGLAGGKQDQYAAAFGGFNFMEFYKDDEVLINPLRIKEDYILELENNLLLFFTGKSRFSAEIIEKQVKAMKSDDGTVEYMHKMKDAAFEMKKLLLKGRLYELGELLDVIWRYKKNTGENVSTDFIDEIYTTARESGAIGGKVSGAGGGGFMFFYCPGNNKYKVIQNLSKFKGDIRRFEFIKEGLITWET